MDNINKVMQAIYIGVVVAKFLLTTSRVLKAIELCKECLILINNFAPYISQTSVKSLYIIAYFLIFNCYALVSDYTSAIKWGRELLVLLREFEERQIEGKVTIRLAALYERQCKFTEATELYKKALSIVTTTGERRLEQVCYQKLGIVFHSIGEYAVAENFLQQALQISQEIDDKIGKAEVYIELGNVFLFLGKYVKAEEHYRKGLRITKELDNKNGEATCYGNLGTLFYSRGEYDKAEGILERAFKIRKAIGDKDGEAADLENLGTVFLFRAEYVKAEEFLQKSLQITKKTVNKMREASVYDKLGSLFHSLHEYVKAKEFHQKALDIRTESGEKRGEAFSYTNLGTVFQSLGEYAKAEKYLQKALGITKAIGHKKGEATCYGNLGSVFQSKGEFIKAEEHYLKAHQIRKEIGDKEGEAADYANLGTLFQSVGNYAKAEECLEKALAITKETGNKKGQAAAYVNLGAVFSFVGENVKAEEYYQKALQITIEIGDKRGEASCYGNLGSVFLDLDEYDKAKNFTQKALQISIGIGDQCGTATHYGNQGEMFCQVGEYDKAEEHLRKSLQIRKKIGDQQGEAFCYQHLGTMFFSVGEYSKAKKFHEKALELSYTIGDVERQFNCHLDLTVDSFYLNGNVDGAVSNLFESIKKSQKLWDFLRDNDQFKISFLDKHVLPYQILTLLFCTTGKHYKALHVVELGRARALADLMSVRYCVEIQISADQESWVGIEKIVKESGRVCLYISYFGRLLFLWVIKRNKVILFRQMDINDSFGYKERIRNVNEVFGDVTFRKFPHLSQGQYEDRSLSHSNISHLTCESFHECSQEDSRPIVTEDDDETQFDEPPSLSECYKMIIAPVADLLDEPEIIIVPDHILYKVPFSAFKDESGKYLSESFRLRIVPSLMTLKLIQDSPGDYHSQTGALIVGDPQVGHVTYKGELKRIPPLPCARKEAEMIGRLLGVQPLLGEHATKQAVLQSIHSVSLIHFAAHGNAESGEIALAPPRHFDGTPQEQDYLLTMTEISQVRLTAKLVVLSCCHSADGQIRSEGVVGIARAFLGSGARSVLVALWAIQDEATEQFMSRFYEHLVGGESASESLHQAMKWMRANGFSDVEQWAPFMLIGDNVTFDFGE